jgi:preprotein translocase subunit SecG
MGVIDWILLVVAVIVIILCLLQGGKSEGASGAITGGGLNVFVKTKERGIEKVVSILTLIIAIVFFAFWAYKFFVFRSRSMEKKVLIPEFIGFASARLLTLAFETGFIFVFVNLLDFNQAIHFGFTRMVYGAATSTQFGITIKEYYIFKFIATVFVTIMNYIASKLIIFRNANKGKAEENDDSCENK